MLLKFKDIKSNIFIVAYFYYEITHSSSVATHKNANKQNKPHILLQQKKKRVNTRGNI